MHATPPKLRPSNFRVTFLSKVLEGHARVRGALCQLAVVRVDPCQEELAKVMPRYSDNALEDESLKPPRLG